MYAPCTENKLNIPRIVAYQRSKVHHLDLFKSLVPPEVDNIGDCFAGTGVISLLMKSLGKAVYANDYLYASYIICKGLLENEEDLEDEIYELNHGGYVSSPDHWFVGYYGDLYFRKENCMRIAGIREEIEKRYRELSPRKAALLCGMLMGVDRCHCTRGQWFSLDVKRKKQRKYQSEFRVFVPPYSRKGVGFSYFGDYRGFLRNKKFDLLIVDPPDSVSLRNYRAAYHMLDTVCLWDRPRVKWRIRVREEINMKTDYLVVPQMVQDCLSFGFPYVILCLNDVGLVQPQKAYELFHDFRYNIVKNKVYVKYSRVGERVWKNASDILEMGKPGKFMERVYLLKKS